MVESGSALAVMGNHELNAIAYQTRDGLGGYLREHSAKNNAQHAATLADFANREEEWQEYLRWFETLPLFLELDGARIVHACWDGRAVQALGGDNRFHRRMLQPHVGLDSAQQAVNTLLKGPEVVLPHGCVGP